MAPVAMRTAPGNCRIELVQLEWKEHPFNVITSDFLHAPDLISLPFKRCASS